MNVMYTQTLNSLQEYLSQQLVDLSRQCCESTLWTAHSDAASMHSIEVLDTETEILLQAVLPHVVAQTLDIQITPETIYIAGERQKLLQGKTYTDFEVSFHPFQNIIPLPELIQPNTAIAQFAENILTVRCQKSGRMRQAVQLKCQAGWELPSNHSNQQMADPLAY